MKRKFSVSTEHQGQHSWMETKGFIIVNETNRNTSWEMPASRNCSDKDSLCSTLVVPTSTGRPTLFILDISTRTARHFPFVALKTTSESSCNERSKVNLSQKMRFKGNELRQILNFHNNLNDYLFWTNNTWRLHFYLYSRKIQGYIPGRT